MEPADLDRRLSRALERLPAPQAPATLLPRVLEAVAREEHAPWYRREWRDWPLGWQIVSGLTCTAVVVVALGFGPSTERLAGNAFAPAQAVSTQVEPTVAALQVLWRVVLEPLLPAAVGFVLVILVMGAACAAIVLTINYVVIGRTSQR